MGTGSNIAHLANQCGDVLDRGRQQTSGQQHLTAEAVSQNPEDFVTDLGLQAIDGQHDTALRTQQGTEALRVGSRQSAQLIVAVEQVSDRPLGDHDPATTQFGVNLRDTAVFDIPEVADQGNDVEAELMMGQGIMGFGLGAIGLVKAWARGVRTSPDAEDQSHEALQGGDRTTGVVSVPKGLSTFRAVLGQRRELEGVLGSWSGSCTHGEPPRWYPTSFYAPRR
jgi:hypothetical protein